MRKRFAMLTLIVSVLCSICLLTPIGSVAFAEKTQFSVKYYYDGNELFTSEIYNSTLTNLPGYTELSYNNAFTSETEGKKICYKLNSETGENITLPLTVTSDISIYIVLEDTDEKVTYTYVYDKKSNIDFSKKEMVYPVGKKVAPLTEINGRRIIDSELYSDDIFTKKAGFKEYAETNQTYYPLLNENVTFTVNGTSYTCAYGSNIPDVTSNGTHKYLELFTNAEKTSKYNLTAVNGISLFGDYTRTHYSVTFMDGETPIKKFVPIEKPIVTTALFPDYITDVEWRIVESEKVEYPLTIDNDIVLYATNGLNNPLTKFDRIILHTLGTLLVIMAVWGGIYEHRKTVKKRLSEEAVSASVGEIDKEYLEGASDDTEIKEDNKQEVISIEEKKLSFADKIKNFFEKIKAFFISLFANIKSFFVKIFKKEK